MVTPGETTRRFRALFISDVHLGTRGCQAERLLDFLRHHDADTIYLVGDIVDGWQLRSSWYWPLGPQRRGAEAPAQGAQGRAHDLYPGQPRRVPARLLRHAFRRRRGGRKRAARRGRRTALSRHAWRQFRPRGAPRALARDARRPRVSVRAHPQHDVQRRPAPVRPALLVAVAMGQAQGQERRQLHRRVREHARDRGRPPCGRRRDLRPHPSRRDPRLRRRALHQLRRLGRELQRGGRASGRPIRDHLLGARTRSNTAPIPDLAEARAA